MHLCFKKPLYATALSNAGRVGGIADRSLNLTRGTRARPLASRCSSFRERRQGRSSPDALLSIRKENVTQHRPGLFSIWCNPRIPCFPAEPTALHGAVRLSHAICDFDFSGMKSIRRAA